MEDYTSNRHGGPLPAFHRHLASFKKEEEDAACDAPVSNILSTNVPLTLGAAIRSGLHDFHKRHSKDDRDRRQVAYGQATREHLEPNFESTHTQALPSEWPGRSCSGLSSSSTRRAWYEQKHKKIKGNSPATIKVEDPSAMIENDNEVSANSENTNALKSSKSDLSKPKDIRNLICNCLVSYQCYHQRTNQLDCGPFVLEPRQKLECQDEELFTRQMTSGPLKEKQVNDNTLLNIASLLRHLMNAVAPETQKARVADIRQWLIDNQNIDIRSQQVLLVQQQILPVFNDLFRICSANQNHSLLPIYIKEYLLILRIKWSRQDWSGAIKRGLIATVQHNGQGNLTRTTYSSDKNWQHYKNGAYYGQGDLVNGQVWYSRVELMRDGVHAVSQAGISGKVETGAYSIVLGAFDEKNNEGYADIDFGEKIDYVGTALPGHPAGETIEVDKSAKAGDQEPTRCTRIMKASLRTRIPVRVIRSWSTCNTMTNKSTKGYRFDGMYVVTGESALKMDRQIWSFVLERCPGQGMLRGLLTHEANRRRIQQRSMVDMRKTHFERGKHENAIQGPPGGLIRQAQLRLGEL